MVGDTQSNIVLFPSLRVYVCSFYERSLELIDWSSYIMWVSFSASDWVYHNSLKSTQAD